MYCVRLGNSMSLNQIYCVSWISVPLSATLLYKNREKCYIVILSTSVIVLVPQFFMKKRLTNFFCVYRPTWVRCTAQMCFFYFLFVFIHNIIFEENYLFSFSYLFSVLWFSLSYWCEVLYTIGIIVKGGLSLKWAPGLPHA